MGAKVKALLGWVAVLVVACAGGCGGRMTLTGQPSWFALGGEVYHEDSRVEAQQQVLAFGAEPRWFQPIAKPVTRAEFEAYEKSRQTRGVRLASSRGDGQWSVPEAFSYPSRVEDLPLENQGARLELAIHRTADPRVLEFVLTLTASERTVLREIEHRYTNVLPVLFAFYAENEGASVAQAVSVPPQGVAREGGVNSWVPLVETGGKRVWALRVDTESLARFLPKPGPVHLGVVAVFCERQHWGYAGEDEAALMGGYSSEQPSRPVLVRSDVAVIDWEKVASGLASALAAATTPPPLSPEEAAADVVWMASVGGTDSITQTHIHNLLARSGITSLMEGSVAYGVGVPPKDYERAWRILKADSEKMGYYIIFGGQNARKEVREPQWKTTKVGLDYASALARPEYAEGTPLGAVLREQRLADLAPRCPYVDEVRTVERPYLGDDGQMLTGYEVVFEMRSDKSPKALTASSRYQAYFSGGKWQVAFQGGSAVTAGSSDVTVRRRFSERHYMGGSKGQRC